MTAAIPIAVEAAESGVASTAATSAVAQAPSSVATAARGASASRAVSTGGGRSMVERTGTDLTGSRGPKAPPKPRGTGRPPRGSGGSSSRKTNRSSELRGFNPLKTTGGSAHKIVIAEFIICVILIGMAPIATRQPTGGHLYVAKDFLRITAACLLFFILALLANGPKTARFAAAFGALVTLGAAFTARQTIQTIADLINKGLG